jgi:K319-like protein/VCBS repeat protein/PKD domain-containing protein
MTVRSAVGRRVAFIMAAVVALAVPPVGAPPRGVPIVEAAACVAPTFGGLAQFAAAHGTEAVVTGDFNNDGKVDAATANFPGNSVSVMTGDGSGGFGAAQTVPSGGTGPTALAVADLDGDHNLDLVVANQGSNNVTLLLGNGAGGFGAPAAFATNDQPVAVAVGDLDGNTTPDIAVAPLFGRAGVLYQTGSGAFGPYTALAATDPGINPTGVVVGDFDGSGGNDVAVSAIASELRVYFDDGHGGFQRRVVPMPAGAVDLAAGDFNNDGNLDLVAVDSVGGKAQVALGKGKVGAFDPPFMPAVTFAVGDTPVAVASGDVTADGNVDLVVANRFDDTISVLAGDGSGSFAAQLTFAAGDGPDRFALADVNADGALDVALPAANEDKLSVVLNTCPIGPVNLQVTGIEVTQSIQDMSNSVPLVAGKRTFVRVYVKGNVSIANMSARLSGNAGGVALGRPLWPLNPGAVITVPSAPNRARLDGGFYFELPASWLTGTVSLTAELNPFHNPNESSFADNSATINISFLATHALKVRLVNYIYKDTRGNVQRAPDWMFDAIESKLRREFPISKLDVSRGEFVDGGAPFSADTILTPNSTGGGDVGEMNRRMTAWRNGADPGVAYVGIALNRGGGIVDAIGGWNAIAGDEDTAAHEVGHLMGRSHTNCSGDEAGVDLSYPYAGGKIGGPASALDRFFGFDVGDTGLLYPVFPHVVANTTGDLMSYCGARWLSDYNYTRIRTYIDQTFTSYDPTGDFLQVYGQVDLTSQTASLSVLRRLSQVGVIPTLVPGQYHIRLFNAAGAQLADYSFSPTSSTQGGSWLQIAQVVTFVPGTRRIAIFSDLAGREIASSPVSASAPVVSVITPVAGSLASAGPVNVSWAAGDADGDALRYAVEYSPDAGASWRALAINLAGTSYSIDAGQLAGTGGSATGLLRVVATDGVQSADGDSGALVVAGKKPSIEIHSPLDGATFVRGQGVSLDATALDIEDGVLGDAEIAWSSDRDGTLGNGQLIQPSLLSLGTHVVTARATDSDGNTAAAAITVHVVGKLAGGSLPVANAGPDIQALEGQSVTLDGSGSSDPDGDPIAYSWSVVAATGPSVVLGGSPATPSFVATDSGTYVFRLTVSDGNQGASSDDVVVTVGNVAPVVSITAPSPGLVVPVGQAVTFAGGFNDPGVIDRHLAQWSFDALTTAGIVDEANRSVTATYAFAAPGVYQIRLTVSDRDGGSGSSSTVAGVDDFVVVYDPRGGFVTGGGWILSPAWSVPGNPSITGRATFGFVSRYANGATTPSGELEFDFDGARIKLHSVSYQWLVVAGASAQFKGTGSLNGVAGYGFLVTAKDQATKSDADKFRIKIWNQSTGQVVYDNSAGSPDDIDGANPQPIGGGSIVVHG